MTSNKKTEILDLIGEIEDEKVLEQVYDILYSITSTDEDGLFESLTRDQKERVSRSYNESLDPEKLRTEEEFKLRFSKWL